MRRLVFLAAFLSLLAPAVAPAADTEVDVELVLAVDVSRSMDYDEARLQREGYIAAFTSPEVLQAIADGAVGKIAVTYVEWAGPGYRQVIVPWMVVGGAADAQALADKLAAAPLTRERGTSISNGLTFAASLFDGNGFVSFREAIDVSGDGPNNAGVPVVPVRDALIEQGLTINGLPIVLKTGGGIFNGFNIPNLDVYYEDCVIGGPGAFMVTVTDVSEFPAAIRRKLVQEIAGVMPRITYAAETLRPPRIDCLIGEKRRRNFFNNNDYFR